MSIQRNQSVISYTIIPEALENLLELFMCDTEVCRDSFRRMEHFYWHVHDYAKGHELNVLEMFLVAENIDRDNAWIQFW